MDEEMTRKLNFCPVLYFDRIFTLRTPVENFFIHASAQLVSVKGTRKCDTPSENKLKCTLLIS
jgi:hypothetical protein